MPQLGEEIEERESWGSKFKHLSVCLATGAEDKCLPNGHSAEVLEGSGLSWEHQVIHYDSRIIVGINQEWTSVQMLPSGIAIENGHLFTH